MPDADDLLYQEILADHAAHPRTTAMSSGTACCALENSSCADAVQLQIVWDGDRIAATPCSVKGCSIAIASASIMSVQARGWQREDARQRGELLCRLLRGETAEADVSELGEAAALLALRPFATRIRCATLPWEALLQCIAKDTGAGKKE